MTLSTWTSTNNYSTDALYRTEITNIHNALSAVGLVQTSDTGQCNPATLTRSSSTNTVVGYEIWRFNDSLQSSYPCFIKLEYGSGLVASTSISVWVTVGSATDGAGNITGTMTTTRYQFFQSSITSAANYTSGISGSSSRLTMVFNPGSSSYYVAWWFSVERIQSTSGNDTNLGLVFVGANRASSTVTQCVYYGTNKAQPAASTVLGTLLLNDPSGTSWAVGNNIGTGPIIPIGWGTHPPVQGGLCYYNGDLTALTTYTINVYGSDHTYLAVGSNSIGAFSSHGSTVSVLARWD